MIQNKKDSVWDLIRLLSTYFSRRLNFQHFLYFFVFITFDIGDAVTAAAMMDSKGVGVEYNFIIQYVYSDFGLAGLIAAKLWLIIVPLMIASIIIKKSFWFINGILAALIILGIMAIQANLQEISGLPHMSPMQINMIYLTVLFVFGLIGMFIDDRRKDRPEGSLYYS